MSYQDERNDDEQDTSSAQGVEELLSSLLGEMVYDAEHEALADAGLPELKEARTYEAGGMMTSDKGLTLRFADGGEYQITIVRSR